MLTTSSSHLAYTIQYVHTNVCMGCPIFFFRFFDIIILFHQVQSVSAKYENNRVSDGGGRTTRTNGNRIYFIDHTPFVWQADETGY